MFREILIVNGCPTTQHSVKQFLQPANVREPQCCASTCTAVDGVKYMREYRPDLIIVDFSSGRLESAYFLEYLTNRDQFHSIPVIIVSSSDTDHGGRFDPRHEGLYVTDGQQLPALLSDILYAVR